MKRFIATMLAVMMLITMIPTSVFAENTIEPTATPIVTVEPTAESTEEPTAVPTEEPAMEPTEEPVVESTEEPAVEPTDEPVVEPTEEPVVEPTDKTVVESTEEPAVEPTDEPVVEPTDEPVVEPTEEPVVEPTDEPVVEPTDEPVVEPTDEPVVEPTEEPIVEPTEEPVVESTEEPVVESTVEPTIEPVVQLDGGNDSFSTAPLTFDDLGIGMPMMRRSATYLNPQTKVLSGKAPFDQIIENNSGFTYPFQTTFELDADYMPQNSVYMAIRCWDVNEESSLSHAEYDQVYVNGTLVGTLTGEGNTWNTSLVRVPVDCLKAGTNTITIYVGMKFTEDATINGKYYSKGTILRDSVYDGNLSPRGYWLMKISQIQILCDGGSSEGKPDVFRVNLTNAELSGNQVNCYVTTQVKDSQNRTFSLEYALYDWSSEESATYGQIIDDEFATIYGGNDNHEGSLTMPVNSLSGTYTAVVYLKVKENGTETILAYDEESFEYETGIAPAFDVQNFTATPATLEWTSEPVAINLSADIDVNAGLTNLYFYISDAIQTPASVDANGHVTGTLVLPENGFYTVELHYTKEGKNYKKTTTVEINNILAPEDEIPGKLGEIRLNVEQDDLVIEENFEFTWNEVEGADHYLFSLRDITDNDEGPLLYERERIEVDAGNSFAVDLTAGRRYRAWICAVPEGMDHTAPQSSAYSAEFSYRIVPAFEVTGFDGNGMPGASGTLTWSVPTSKNGIIVNPDQYVVYVYHSDDNGTKQVYDAVVDGATTSLLIDGGVAFTEYGLYTITVYATMYESWGGPFHAVADLTPTYEIAAPDESKITASGIMLYGKHQRNNTPVYTGTYTFWAAGNNATTEIFADNNVSMKREGEYNGNPRFILENVKVSEGIKTYKFHTANGSSNGIKIYGVTKYDAPKTKYVIEDGAALRYMPEKSSSVIGSLELAAEVKAYGEIDISSNEGYEYISYNGAYYFVDKTMVSDTPIKEDVVDIFTASGSEFFSYGEDIELKWKVDIEGENLTGKIDVCHKNIAGYFDGIGGITGKKLVSGSWDITESVLENDEEGLYYANLKVYDGDKLVAEDIVYFTVSYDVNMTFLDNLDRDDLELWLDNQNPRENWDEYKRGGYLLLEETLEDNWGGWIHEGAYQVYQFGMDILGLDLIGLGLDIYELTDDDKEIEALLLENYAQYLSSIQSELALIEEEAKWSKELYKWYDILSDGWDNIDEDIPDFGILNEFMGGEKIDIIHFVSLHTSVKLQLSESIANFYLWAGNNEKAHKWIERALSECAEIDLIHIEMQNPKYISLSNKLNRSVEIGSHVISLVGLGLDIKEAVDKQGIAAEKYEEIISIIAQYQEGYLDILDSYIAAADGSRKSALENFKNSIHSISVEMSAQAICDIAKTYADNETADDWREVGGSIVEITGPVFWEATKLIVEVYCENYNVPLPKWLNKLSDFEIDFSVTDWIGFGISLTDELLLHIDDKEAVLKEMLYYEQLKADLAEATLDEFDAYRRNNHTIEQANKIITALKFMKQLKYSGEYKALELCALLTDYYNYSDSQYTRVYKINGSWCAIGGYGIQELVEDEVIEEVGYVLSATISLNGSSAGDTMITIGGAVVSPLVGVSEEEILTSEELAIALEQDALFMEYIKKSRETNPDNYDWWVKYVEDNTSSRIEALDIP